jgi:methyl coenzyme M reductase subunit D
MELQARLSLEFSLRDVDANTVKIKVLGRVVRCSKTPKGFEVGVQFVDLNEPTRLAIQKIFQLNQVYGEYLNIINHQDNFTDRERIIAEILFFDFTHEDGKVFSNFQKLVDDYSKYLLPLTYDSKLSREFSRLLNGMNAGGKYHYEFPNDSSDVRASEIKTVIRKITSF